MSAVSIDGSDKFGPIKVTTLPSVFPKYDIYGQTKAKRELAGVIKNLIDTGICGQVIDQTGWELIVK